MAQSSTHIWFDVVALHVVYVMLLRRRRWRHTQVRCLMPASVCQVLRRQARKALAEQQPGGA